MNGPRPPISTTRAATEGGIAATAAAFAAEAAAKALPEYAAAAPFAAALVGFLINGLLSFARDRGVPMLGVKQLVIFVAIGLLVGAPARAQELPVPPEAGDFPDPAAAETPAGTTSARFCAPTADVLGKPLTLTLTSDGSTNEMRFCYSRLTDETGTDVRTVELVDPDPGACADLDLEALEYTGTARLDFYCSNDMGVGQVRSLLLPFRGLGAPGRPSVDLPS